MNNKDITDWINSGEELVIEPASVQGNDTDSISIEKYHLSSRWSVFLKSLKERKAGGYDNVPTGISGLDKRIGGGYPRGAVSLLCGPPGVSKSTLAINNSLHAAVKNNDPVIFWTYELEPEDLQARMVCIRHGVDWGEVRRGMHNDLVARMADEMQGLPYCVVGRNDCREIKSLASIVARVTELHGKSPFVIIDHVQLLMRSAARDPRSAADLVADQLLGMAIETKSAVLAISSVGRDKYDLASKGPPPLGRVLAMAKESGRFESDAGLQMGLSNVLVTDAKRTSEANIWLSIAKCRFGGEIGNMMLRYNGRSGTFSEVDPETISSPPGGRLPVEIKRDILNVTREHDLRNKTEVGKLVVGRKQKIFDELTKMLADKTLIVDSNGFVKPSH